MKFNKVTVITKKKKQYLKVEFNKAEVSKDKQIWDAKFVKQSDQLMSRLLSDSFEKLEPHLMYASEMADTSIMLDETIDAKKWFDEFKHREEERFQGVVVTSVDFIGNNDVIESVKLYGYRETQTTDKPFKVKFETPVINLDRAAENHYPLVHLLDEHVSDLSAGILAWLEKGETLSTAQQAMFEADNA